MLAAMSPLTLSRPLQLLYPDSAYGRKLCRALEHLEEVERIYIAYRDSSPYVAVRDRETNPNPRVWIYRAELRREVDPRLPVVVGDLVHNLRSALDHLQAALVPVERKRDVMFPVQWQDPWPSDENTGKYAQSTEAERARDSWTSTMQGIDPEIEALIKQMQPYSAGYGPEMHPVAQLSTLDNADKHFELVELRTGIGDSRLTISNPEANIQLTMFSDKPETVLTGGVVAEFAIRPSNLKAITDNVVLRESILATMADGNAEMDVELTGTAEVAVRPGGGMKMLIPIPEGLEHLFSAIVTEVVGRLEPFARAHGRVV
jgi:hypothetical protein